jgi:hypothetical protein
MRGYLSLASPPLLGRLMQRCKVGASCAALVDEMTHLSAQYDVRVVGGGNAALCAAISARCDGASVLVVEEAPKFYRGAKTRHTRNFRCGHDNATEVLSGTLQQRRALFNRGTLRYQMELDCDILSALTDQQSPASDGR